MLNSFLTVWKKLLEVRTSVKEHRFSAVFLWLDGTARPGLNRVTIESVRFCCIYKNDYSARGIEQGFLII